jgi:hypothetical protein
MFFNVAIAFISNTFIKLCVVIVMVRLVGFYLLPDYPVRAAAYSFFAGSLTVFVVWVASQSKDFKWQHN